MDVHKTVLPEHEPCRLDVYLTKLFKYHSRNSWQKKIEGGEILVNGKPGRSNLIVRPGDRIVYLFPPGLEPDVDPTFRIIHQDADIVLVNKSGDLPTHAVGKYRTNNLRFLVRHHLQVDYLSPANRLDRETSGLVLFSLHPEAAAALSRQFMKHTVEKTYQAIVFGVIAEDSFTVDEPVGNDESSSIRIKQGVNRERGLPSLTRFQVRQRFPGYTFVECYPKTGRTNQIRIHLAHYGHPIVGDKLFVENGAPFLEFVENGMSPQLLDRLKMPRQALHNFSLGFIHPGTKEKVSYTAPLPEDMEEFLKKLDSISATAGPAPRSSVPG